MAYIIKFYPWKANTHLYHGLTMESGMYILSSDCIYMLMLLNASGKCDILTCAKVGYTAHRIC